MENIHTAVAMYNAGDVLRDEFEKHSTGIEDHKARRRSLIIPMVIVYIFGIEIGLKAVIRGQRQKPDRIHDLLKLYDKLSLETQESINEKVSAIGITVTSVRSVMEEHRNDLQEWRYPEDSDGKFVVDLNILKATLGAIIETYNEKYGAVIEGMEQISKDQTRVPLAIQLKASEYGKNALGR